MVATLAASSTAPAKATPRAAPIGSGQADFNGDGYADLAIGIPYEAYGSLAEAGAVQLLYGSGSGLQATSPPESSFLTQASPDVKDAPEADDVFGFAVATGDFNRDGYTDLAVGVPGEVVGSVGSGAVQIFYGTSAGLQAVSPDDQLFAQNSMNVKGTAQNGDNFGRSVRSADFNADGFADLAIGIPFKSVGQATGAGAVQILYGSSAGLQAVSPDDQVFTQDSPGGQGFIQRLRPLRLIPFRSRLQRRRLQRPGHRDSRQDGRYGR